MSENEFRKEFWERFDISSWFFVTFEVVSAWLNGGYQSQPSSALSRTPSFVYPAWPALLPRLLQKTKRTDIRTKRGLMLGRWELSQLDFWNTGYGLLYFRFDATFTGHLTRRFSGHPWYVAICQEKALAASRKIFAVPAEIIGFWSCALYSLNFLAI